MSKIWTNGGYNYLIEWNTLWEKEKLLVTSNFSVFHNVFKSCLLLMCQNEYLWSKELRFPYKSMMKNYHRMPSNKGMHLRSVSDPTSLEGIGHFK